MNQSNYMNKMKYKLLTLVMTLSSFALFQNSVLAQAASAPVMSTPPATQEEMDALYENVLDDRVLKIVEALALTDSAVSNHVRGILIDHYHALRARDEAIDDELSDIPKGSDQWLSQRDAMVTVMSPPLHDRFLARLAKYLTPQQIEVIKDKMTYGKVKFTYDAYCMIVPGLNDADKAKIMDLLKQAREVAIDGGNASEKSAIFQKYKDRINTYLATQGVDVEKALKEWSEKHPDTNSPVGK